MRCGTAIFLALAALTSAHQQPAMLTALPEPYHRQLLSFHASSKANGGDKKWTLDEDAEILMQAKLGAMPVSERKIVVGDRTPEACRNRWRKYLKKEVYEVAPSGLSRERTTRCTMRTNERSA